MKIFHHNDMDGRGAAAVVSRFRNCLYEEDLFEVDYVERLPLEKVKEGEEVWFVDYSFKENTKYVLDELLKKGCGITWIDHHLSSLEFLTKNPQYESIKGLRIDQISGAALCYMYCYNKEYQDIPYYLKLISDYDCWKFKYEPDTKWFKLGLEATSDSPLDLIWDHLENIDVLENILKKGEIIQKHKIQEDNYYRNNFWYETTLSGFKNPALNGIKAAVINKRSNSEIFGSLYEEYPLVITWVFNGKEFIYSFFSKKGGANCKEIAEELGGGGHIGAAGCHLNYLKFIKE